MAENKFIKTGIGVGVSFYDKNANDTPLIEAHKVLVKGEIDENGQLNIDVDTQVRLDDKLVEIDNKIPTNIENGQTLNSLNQKLDSDMRFKTNITDERKEFINETLKPDGERPEDMDPTHPDYDALYFKNGATADYATTLNGKSRAEGKRSLATGSNTLAHGENSFTTGNFNIAYGESSVAEGSNTTALGKYSHAEGVETVAGDYDDLTKTSQHAEGRETHAKGWGAHAEGAKTKANGYWSHSAGVETIADGNMQMVIGSANTTDTSKAFIIGNGKLIGETSANGSNIIHLSHDEERIERSNAMTVDWEGNAWFAGDIKLGGTNYDDENSVNLKDYINEIAGGVVNVNLNIENAEPIDNDSQNNLMQKPEDHKENVTWTSANPEVIAHINENPNTTKIRYTGSNGNYDINHGAFATGKGGNAAVFGGKSQVIGAKSFATGSKNIALGGQSFATGSESFAVGQDAFASGNNTSAVGNYSHTEGQRTVAQGDHSHAEGVKTKAMGNSSHAEGTDTKANGYYSHAEGDRSNANGASSHAEGQTTVAQGHYSHAEGYVTKALGNDSHAEGAESKAEGTSSHAEGNKTEALGENSHAEGNRTKAEGTSSHAEGTYTQALATNAHAEGNRTEARKAQSHTEGNYTIADSEVQHVEGSFNEIDSEGNYLHIVGNGRNEDNRSNAHTLDWDGNAYFAGTVKTDTIEDLNQLFTNGSYKRAADNKLFGLYQKSLWEKDGAGYYAGRNPKLAAITPNDGNAILQLQSGSVNGGKITEYNLTFTAGVHTGSNTTRDEFRFNKYDSNNPKKWISWATGRDAIALNAVTFAPGGSALAEGQGTIAYGLASHAEGYETIAEGDYSHAEGLGTWAAKDYSHASGYITQTTGEGQTVIGIANNPEDTEDKLFVIGNGSAIENSDKTFTVTKSNAMTVDKNGNGWFAGDITCTDIISGTTISLAKQAFINSMEISELAIKVNTLEKQSSAIASDSIVLTNETAGVTWKVSVDDNGDLIAEKL